MRLRTKAPTVAQIERAIRRACHCDEQTIACLEVALLLKSWLDEEVTFSLERQLPSLGLGALGSVRYWENFAAVVDGRPTFIFLDFRRQKGLTSVGRKFVFSLMGEHIRGVDPDIENPQFLVLQFPQERGDDRRLVDHYADSFLYSFSEMSAMVEETYQIWQAVLQERRSAEPKRGTGGMFG